MASKLEARLTYPISFDAHFLSFFGQGAANAADPKAKAKAKARGKAKAKAKAQAQRQEAMSWEDTVDAACALSSSLYFLSLKRFFICCFRCPQGADLKKEYTTCSTIAMDLPKGLWVESFTQIICSDKTRSCQVILCVWL